MLRNMFKQVLHRLTGKRKPNRQAHNIASLANDSTLLTPNQPKAKTLTLTDLPPELRLPIYELCFADLCRDGGWCYFREIDYAQKVHRFVYKDSQWRNKRGREITTLLRVCRVLRVEASPVFWTSFVKAIEKTHGLCRLPLPVWNMPHIVSLVTNLKKYAPEATRFLQLQLQLQSEPTSTLGHQNSWPEPYRKDIYGVLDMLHFNGVLELQQEVQLPWNRGVSDEVNAWKLESGSFVIRVRASTFILEGHLASLEWDM